MSARSDASDHVHVRGTMVSTQRLRPSRLSVRCVERWGMPNQHGTLLCDEVLIHVRYDRHNDDLIHAWAQVPPIPPADEAWCVVA